MPKAFLSMTFKGFQTRLRIATSTHSQWSILCFDISWPLPFKAKKCMISQRNWDTLLRHRKKRQDLNKGFQIFFLGSCKQQTTTMGNVLGLHFERHANGPSCQVGRPKVVWALWRQLRINFGFHMLGRKCTHFLASWSPSVGPSHKLKSHGRLCQWMAASIDATKNTRPALAFLWPCFIRSMQARCMHVKATFGTCAFLGNQIPWQLLLLQIQGLSLINDLHLFRYKYWLWKIACYTRLIESRREREW